ncbi:hypothetical protein BREVNS_1808 [Brevinematales bacterium NS]|nr:hypothetical protein BREVNS_1808 [Brevinematales bacterium NS]
MGIEKILGTLDLKTTNYWVSLLKTLPPHEVGVIKVSAKLCYSSTLLQSFVEEIRYLVKEAGIILPIVVEARKDFIDFYQKRLILALTKANIPFTSCPPELVHLEPSLKKNQWKVDTIFTAPVIEAILEGKIPVLCAGGISPQGDIVPIPGLLLARELVYTLHAKKLILVGHTPIRTKSGRFVTEILSQQEWQKKILSREIPPAMARRVTSAFDLLSRLGPGHSVQITRPKYHKHGASTGLLEELLGNGSGTYLALPPQITVYPLSAIDESWLFQTISEAFSPLNKKLKKDYFSTIRPYHPLVYLDSLRKGGAIVYSLENTPYMCKLFTRQDYEGIGIGSTVIHTIYKHFGSLCWRTSLSNEKAELFYEKLISEYDGISLKTPHYTLYFLGKAKTKKNTLATILDNLPSSFE